MVKCFMMSYNALFEGGPHPPMSMHPMSIPCLRDIIHVISVPRPSPVFLPLFCFCLSYSSKFLWHNIFVNFVINLEITKICSRNILNACHKVDLIARSLKNGQDNIESRKLSDREIFIMKIYFNDNLERYMNC